MRGIDRDTPEDRHRKSQSASCSKVAATGRCQIGADMSASQMSFHLSVSAAMGRAWQSASLLSSSIQNVESEVCALAAGSSSSCRRDVNSLVEMAYLRGLVVKLAG